MCCRLLEIGLVWRIQVINWQEDNRHSSVSYQADVLIQGEEGWPIAMVEVKNRQGLTAEVATAIRRNLLAHGLLIQQVPFFLVVSQDAGFLWMQPKHQHPVDPPTVEFPMHPVVRHYVRWLGTGERLGGSALEIAVATWLSDQSVGGGPDIPETTEPLSEIGFLDAIRGATVRINERV
jgi:hypothetical protein